REWQRAVDVHAGLDAVRGGDRDKLLLADEIAGRPDAVDGRSLMLVHRDAAVWPRSATELFGEHRLEHALDGEEGGGNRPGCPIVEAERPQLPVLTLEAPDVLRDDLRSDLREASSIVGPKRRGAA